MASYRDSFTVLLSSLISYVCYVSHKIHPSSYEYLNTFQYLLVTENVRETYDSTTQQRTPPLSLSESDGVGDLLDDLPRSWFTADGPAFLRWRSFTLFQKIVCCSGLKTLPLIERPGISLHSFTALMGWSCGQFILCERIVHICITKFHTYYINYIIYFRFGRIWQRSGFDPRSCGNCDEHSGTGRHSSIICLVGLSNASKTLSHDNRCAADFEAEHLPDVSLEQ
jgi:hypothetical protein